MYHYVALLWPPLDRRASHLVDRMREQLRALGPHWACVADCNGMLVFAMTPREKALSAHVLPGDVGVLLGTLYQKNRDDCPHSKARPTREQAATMSISGGQSLVDHYWGTYVAFLRQDGRRACVVRDCSGRIPCFHTCYEQIHILFSAPADLAALQLPPFSIHLRYLAAFIYAPQLQIRETGLAGVTEVLAGESLQINGNHTCPYPLWNPAHICRAAAIDSYEEAVAAVRTTTQGCVATWSAAYEAIVHKLSGGLDSAVVLGCLRNVRDMRTVTCLNLFGENPCEDERRYARLAAKQAACTLVEDSLDSEEHAFDARQFDVPPMVKPATVPLFSVLNINKVNRTAAQLKADVIWTGQGGDHLFLQTRSDVSAADYVRDCGFTLGLPRAIADAAKISRIPYAFVLKNAWNQRSCARRRRPKEFSPNEAHPFLNAEALPGDIEEYVTHPWMAYADDLPIGKQSQLYYLAEVLNRHRPLPTLAYAHEHHPLLSQPLIELCLQIPTYLLVRGGRQRALARKAFEDCVPREILEREDKGDISFTVTDTIRRSEGFLRDLMLDGWLVQQRLVSRQALERYIVKKQPLRLEQCGPLLACIAAEIWARSWTNSAAKIGA